MADHRVTPGGGAPFAGTPAAFDPMVADPGCPLRPVEERGCLEVKPSPAEAGKRHETRRESASIRSPGWLRHFRQLLTGDAGQRALIAWHLGWEPAKQISGQAWMARLLAELLLDPYSSVRYISQRSLKRLPGFAQFSYDFIGPEAERSGARQRALEIWRGRLALNKVDPRLSG